MLPLSIYHIHLVVNMDPSGKQQYFVSACWVGQIQPFSSIGDIPDDFYKSDPLGDINQSWWIKSMWIVFCIPQYFGHTHHDTHITLTHTQTAYSIHSTSRYHQEHVADVYGLLIREEEEQVHEELNAWRRSLFTSLSSMHANDKMKKMLCHHPCIRRNLLWILKNIVIFLPNDNGSLNTHSKWLIPCTIRNNGSRTKLHNSPHYCAYCTVIRWINTIRMASCHVKGDQSHHHHFTESINTFPLHIGTHLSHTHTHTHTQS